jgi:hypothetical protein
VYENRVLRRIFRPKGAEVTGDWRRLYDEELHNSYTSRNSSSVTKLRMRWVGHVERMGEIINISKNLCSENLKGRDNLKILA